MMDDPETKAKANANAKEEEEGKETTPPAAKKVSKDPLHGITLKMMLTRLVEELGWDEMSSRIRINCFAHDPSINSSLKFLRKTFWARRKVEELYLLCNFPERLEE